MQISTMKISTMQISTQHLINYTHAAFPLHLPSKHSDRQALFYFDLSVLPIKMSLADDVCSLWVQSAAQIKSINLRASDDQH
jgi:hypothetical protein